MNLLIDGSSLLWRTHYANKASGRATVQNNVHLFLKSLKSYSSNYNCRNIYIAWDKKMGEDKNFRHLETGGDYKGHRDKDEAQVVYEAQPKIDYATSLLGCKNMYPWIMEADDIIAWLSKTLEGQSVIITSDKDMLQLINNKTCVFHPRKKITIDHTNFENKIGMPIEHYLVYKAILGDPSDNIKGIDGYGPVYSKKLAKQWIEDRNSVDADKATIIERNISLMDLRTGYERAGEKEVSFYKQQLEELSALDTNIDAFEEFCKENEYKSVLKDIDKWKNVFQKPHLLSIFDNMTF